MGLRTNSLKPREELRFCLGGGSKTGRKLRLYLFCFIMVDHLFTHRGEKSAEFCWGEDGDFFAPCKKMIGHFIKTAGYKGDR